MVLQAQCTRSTVLAHLCSPWPPNTHSLMHTRIAAHPGLAGWVTSLCMSLSHLGRRLCKGTRYMPDNLQPKATQQLQQQLGTTL